MIRPSSSSGVAFQSRSSTSTAEECACEAHAELAQAVESVPRAVVAIADVAEFVADAADAPVGARDERRLVDEAGLAFPCVAGHRDPDAQRRVGAHDGLVDADAREDDELGVGLDHVGGHLGGQRLGRLAHRDDLGRDPQGGEREVGVLPHDERHLAVAGQRSDQPEAVLVDPVGRARQSRHDGGGLIADEAEAPQRDRHGQVALGVDPDRLTSVLLVPADASSRRRLNRKRTSNSVSTTTRRGISAWTCARERSAGSSPAPPTPVESSGPNSGPAGAGAGTGGGAGAGAAGGAGAGNGKDGGLGGGGGGAERVTGGGAERVTGGGAERVTGGGAASAPGAAPTGGPGSGGSALRGSSTSSGGPASRSARAASYCRASCSASASVAHSTTTTSATLRAEPEGQRHLERIPILARRAERAQQVAQPHEHHDASWVDVVRERQDQHGRVAGGADEIVSHEFAARGRRRPCRIRGAEHAHRAARSEHGGRGHHGPNLRARHPRSRMHVATMVASPSSATVAHDRERRSTSSGRSIRPRRRRPPADSAPFSAIPDAGQGPP